MCVVTRGHATWHPGQLLVCELVTLHWLGAPTPDMVPNR